MPKLPTLEEMLKTGMHFGHKKGKWHPKMKPYIFTERNGIYVVDLEQTQVKLEEALKFVKDTTAKGGVILFVGTKDQAQKIIEKHAKDCGMPYINQRWLGGTLTNFAIILKMIKKYKDMKAKQELGGYKAYTKKEQLDFQREIDDLNVRVGGITEMKKIPEAIFIVDIMREKTALTEATKKGVPVVAICDTNVNPEKVAWPIPANDDATKSIEMLTALIAEAVKEGKAAVASK